MNPPYTISEEQKKQFAGIYVLEYMINKPHYFSIMLSGDDQDLESILEWLLVKEYVAIRKNDDYIPTEKGREALTRFLSRYSEFLNVFDIYCAVDLEVGEFAFSSYFDFEGDESWRQFLAADRWDDLRIAVAEYKKIDPIEIVFMSFIREDRFGKDEVGWQFDLLLGSVWDEILEICNTAIHWDQLGYEDEQGVVSAKEVAGDIVIQGAEIMLELHKKEADLAPKYLNQYEDEDEDESESTNGEVVEKVVIEEHSTEYYGGYMDPFYISPIWLAVWLI